MTLSVTGTPYADTNEESWYWVLQEIEEYPNTDHWQAYKNFVRPLLNAAIDSGIHRYFRAGLSMSHIVLSTADRRLECIDPPPPRITLQCELQPRFLAWSRAQIDFAEPELREDLDEQSAIQVLRRRLLDLWQATRPEECIPLCLLP